MAEAHTTSDDTAIAAASAAMADNARTSCVAAFERWLEEPGKHRREELIGAMHGLELQLIADLKAEVERLRMAVKAGPIKPPVGAINPHPITAAPHGERTPLPRVCAETDGDCA